MTLIEPTNCFNSINIAWLLICQCLWPSDFFFIKCWILVLYTVFEYFICEYLIYFQVIQVFSKQHICFCFAHYCDWLLLQHIQELYDWMSCVYLLLSAPHRHGPWRQCGQVHPVRRRSWVHLHHWSNYRRYTCTGGAWQVSTN